MGEARVVDLGVDVREEASHGDGLGLSELQTVGHRLYVPRSVLLLLAAEATPQRQRQALLGLGCRRLLAGRPVRDAGRGSRGLDHPVVLLVVVGTQRA